MHTDLLVLVFFAAFAFPMERRGALWFLNRTMRYRT